MTNEENYLNQRIGRNNPFRVPEGYFEHFSSQMMEQLPERKVRSKQVFLRPWLYAAACCAAILLTVFTYNQHQSTFDDSQQTVVTADNSFIEEAADYAMIDNMEIYACLSDN